jgi:diguanylate cyclase (GGDEF)-like protein
MKHSIKRNGSLIIFSVLSVFIFSLLIYIYCYDKENDTRQQRSAYNVTTWTDYRAVESMARQIIHGGISVDNSVGNILAFYTVHQSVEVYVGGQLIYQYPVENNNLFSSSPGYCWNFVELPNVENDVEIIIRSPYSQYLSEIPTFYIGNEISLPASIISSQILPFMLCVAMFVFGLVLIIYHMALSHNLDSDGKLLKLGIFSIFLSIWSINECNITTLLLRNNLVTSYMAFLSLMLLPFPFGRFVQTFYQDTNKIWTIFYRANIVQIVFSLALMLLHMYDLRQTLWMTHFILIFIICIVVIQSYRLLKDGVVSRNVKIHLLCICICALTLSMDLIGYYAGLHDNSRYGRIGFFIYILILGMSSMKESISLMKKGQEADAYQRLAYTDQMTGLNNRTCFNYDFEKLSEKPYDITVIDFDLNNLKYTNDTFGHSAGDQYIKSCASIIYDIFKGIGKCYRVGGDEFVVIIQKSSEIDMTHYLAMLESSVDDANRQTQNKNLKMQIAYGYAVYDSVSDKNLEDTYNRADKIMYKDKENKKTIRKR